MSKKKKRPATNCGWIPLVLLLLPCVTHGVKPIFDYSNNMRLVMLPVDTKLGSVIYRLRASDADEHYPLTFTAFDSGKGKTGQVSEYVGITHVDCSTMSICEADVVLTKPLVPNTDIILSLEVKDTNGEATVVESRLQSTAPIGPFVGAPRILRVPESTRVGTIIESFVIRENIQLFRGVHCHLEPADARTYFELNPGFRTNVKEFSQCDLKLTKKLDYEARSAFILQIIAENAWVDMKVDTRNVAVHEVIVEVQDLPDTPPYFLIAPPVTKLPENATIGTQVVQVAAYDGDYAHPRRLRYGLDPTGLPFSNYFDIDPDQGIVKVRKSLQDIDLQPTLLPVMLRILVEELDEKGIATGDRSEADIAIIIDDVINHPPQFLQKSYVTTLEENAPEGTALTFVDGFDHVQDFDKGDNGKLELSVIGFADTFEISPAFVYQDGKFVISVKNSKRLDYEQIRQLNFKIQATELGINKLSATADVTVNLLDVNDNKPQFSNSTYEIEIPENQLPGVSIGKVKAFDADSRENGEKSFVNLKGNSAVLQTFSVDENTGDIILIDNTLIDRERNEKFIMTVEAIDGGVPPLSSQTTIIVNITDVNDNPPIFKKRMYQGFMNSDLTNLRNDVQVEAVDVDKPGTKNSEIRYEIINGNYEKKFIIDSVTGEISLQEPLELNLFRNGKERNFNPKVQRVSDQIVEPVISLTVRAYDLGIPSLDSEVLVHIYTELTSSRTMKFIVYEEPAVIDKKQNQLSELISSMTGGQAEIQDIQPYSDGLRTNFNIDRSDYYEIDYTNEDRNPKNYQDTQDPRSRRSVVDVLITYPSNSVVDMKDITSKLVRDQQDQTSTKAAGNYSKASPDEEKADSGLELVELQFKNAALFWGLIALLILVVIVVLIIACCFCCPGCLLFNKGKLYGATSSHDIKVLSVKNGNGEDLKDARFVEVLRSAGKRIKSASDEARRLAHRKLLGDRVENISHRMGNKVKVYEPTLRDTQNIIFIRDETASTGRSSGPVFVRAMEELNPRQLRESQAFHLVDHSEQRPHQRRGVSTNDDDVQIMKLDDECRITETYERIDGADVLRLEENPIADEVSLADQATSPLFLDASTSPKSEPVRTMSELELFRQKHNLVDDDGQGEFYTAIGPDGKEIILRQYLGDVPSSPEPPGFLSMAMNHLKEKTAARPRNSRFRRPPALIDGEDSGQTTSEDEGIHSLKPPIGHGKYSGPPSVTSAPDILLRNTEEDLTPKHFIRSPIIEETESNYEAETRTRRKSRNYYDRHSYWNDDPDVSLRFKIQDGRTSPEPSYTETKASILRRRNTMAKMMQQEEEKFYGYIDSTGRLMAKNRHWSLTDLPRSHIEEEIKESFIKRWNSLSNDEMMRIRESNFVYEPRFNFPLQKFNNSLLPKANLVQMANITVYPQAEAEQPRKFSKYNPPHSRKRKPRNTSEELIYIRQNFPSDARSSIWNRHGIARNIEHAASPSIAHVNSFGHHQMIDGGATSSNASSEANSRASSILNINPTRNDIEKMVEDGLNSKPFVDENFAKNLGDTPLNSSEDRSNSKESSASPKKSVQVTPRYMNWYNKSQSSIVQPVLDAKKLTMKKRDRRSNSVPHSSKVTPLEQSPRGGEDTESGISSMSQTDALQKGRKQSIFTIAYNDVATNELLPGTADV